MADDKQIQRLEHQILALKNGLILVMREVYRVPGVDKDRLTAVATSLQSITPPRQG